MAQIDVSEVLQDPDFLDMFNFVRLVETVGPDGRATFSGTTLSAYGVIQPASGRTMELTPEATRTSEMLEIWTQAGLQEASDDLAADIVLWQGKEFVPVRNDDFDNWGQGYRHVVLSRKDLLPATSI